MDHITTEEFLYQLDPDAIRYAELIKDKGFTSTRTLRYLQLSDIKGKDLFFVFERDA